MPIDEWKMAQAIRRQEQRQDEQARRSQLIHQATIHIESIRSGQSRMLVHLAKIYFGLFIDVDRELPPYQRLVTETTEEITGAATSGLVTALQSTSLPSAGDIGEAHAESKH